MLNSKEIANLFKLDGESLSSTLIGLNRNYREGTPKMSDSDFDQLESHLKTINPESIYFNSLLKTTSDASKEVELTMPMLSLDKAVNEKEVESYISKERFHDQNMIFSEKIDGMSLELTYELKEDTYAFSKAVTRGDGYIGQDVTEAIQGFASCIPKNIPILDVTTTLVLIRGELYLKKSKLMELNKALNSQGIPEFKNTRNSVPAALSTDKNASFLKYMSFKAFSILRFTPKG